MVNKLGFCDHFSNSSYIFYNVHQNSGIFIGNSKISRKIIVRHLCFRQNYTINPKSLYGVLKKPLTILGVFYPGQKFSQQFYFIATNDGGTLCCMMLNILICKYSDFWATSVLDFSSMDNKFLYIYLWIT